MTDSVTDRLPTSNRMLLVAVGDLLAIAAFVATGELSHGRPVSAGLTTFLSFGVGWFVLATLVDAYDRTALAPITRTLGRTALAWIPAALLGQVIRAVAVPGALLTPTFVLVSLVVGGGFLLAWRLFAALVFG